MVDCICQRRTRPHLLSTQLSGNFLPVHASKPGTLCDYFEPCIFWGVLPDALWLLGTHRRAAVHLHFVSWVLAPSYSEGAQTRPCGETTWVFGLTAQMWLQPNHQTCGRRLLQVTAVLPAESLQLPCVSRRDPGARSTAQLLLLVPVWFPEPRPHQHNEVLVFAAKFCSSFLCR